MTNVGPVSISACVPWEKQVRTNKTVMDPRFSKGGIPDANLEHPQFHYGSGARNGCCQPEVGMNIFSDY